jgi:hypothetical protein
VADKTKRYKLKLSKLDFISAVDVPAQATATVAIIKRRGDELGADFAVAKIDDEAGVVFGFAFTSTVDGKPYFDAQGDAIDESDIVKVALDFALAGAPSDEMHNEQASGRVAFLYPLTADIAKALQIDTKRTGLLAGIKPAPAVLAKFKSGEYTGFSIGGLGQRSTAKGMQVACSKCGQYMEKGLQQCPSCGAEPKLVDGVSEKTQTIVDGVVPNKPGATTQTAPAGKRYVEQGDTLVCVDLEKRTAVHYAPDSRASVLKSVWSTADVDNLPDSSFLYIEGGGKKDEDGKTTPRSLRHFPYKNASGAVDLPHLRDAIGRIPQSSLPADVRARLQAKAEKLLGDQHAKDKRFLDGDVLAAAMRIAFLAGNSTHVMGAPTVGPMSEVDIAKKLERLERIAKLSGAHKTHFDSLAGDAADEFIAKSVADRDAVIAAVIAARTAADEVVYTSPTGEVFRKSDDPRLVTMAKREAAALASAEQERLEKRASAELGYFAKALNVRAAILKAIDGIADEKIRSEAHLALKAANTAMEAVTKANGVNPLADAATDSPIAKFNAALTEFAKAAKKPVAQATADFLLTPEGSALYADAFPNTVPSN